MKTLIINSSPHQNGDTSQLVDKLIQNLKGEYCLVSTYKMQFSPCIDCGKCMRGEKCPFEDDASRLIDKIDSFDSIVVATPLYFNQPTGSFLNFASRLQSEFAKNIVLKSKTPTAKKAGIIVCGGGDSVINSADAEKTIRIVLMQINAKAVAYARSLHTTALPAQRDEKAIAEVLAMAELLSPSEGTAKAIAEGRAIAADPSVKAYTNIEELRAALEE